VIIIRIFFLVEMKLVSPQRMPEILVRVAFLAPKFKQRKIISQW
jgi:hypothetical protein